MACPSIKLPLAFILFLNNILGFIINTSSRAVSWAQSYLGCKTKKIGALAMWKHTGKETPLAYWIPVTCHKNSTQ